MGGCAGVPDQEMADAAAGVGEQPAATQNEQATPMPPAAGAGSLALQAAYQNMFCDEVL